MGTEGKTFWWNKQYTRAELMRGSRWLLIGVGLIHLGIASAMYAGWAKGHTFYEALGFGLMGIFYCGAGLIKSFWLRFVCMGVWVGDLFYANILLGGMRPAAFVFMAIGMIFLYKMWRYRLV